MLAEIIPLLVTSRKKLGFVHLLQARLFSKQERKREENEVRGKKGWGRDFLFPVLAMTEQSRIHHHCTSGANICCHRRTMNVEGGTYNLT